MGQRRAAQSALHIRIYIAISDGGALCLVFTELLSDKLWEKSANYAQLCNLRCKNALTPKLNKLQKSCSCSMRSRRAHWRCVGGRGSCTRRPVSCSVFLPTTFSWQVFAVCFPRGQSPQRIGHSQPKVMTRPDVAAPPVACHLLHDLCAVRCCQAQLCTSSVHGVLCPAFRNLLFFFAKTFHFIA